MVDDEYIDKMAKLCGWKASLVYFSLCRHVNKDQECFPSITLMAQQHGVSRPTIMNGISVLEQRNIIAVGKTRSKGGKWLNNTYTLLDKTGWDYSTQVNVDDRAESIVDTLPSQRGLPDQVSEADTKETHGKGNTYDKETHLLQNGGVLRGKDPFGQVLSSGQLVGAKKSSGSIPGEEIEPTSGSKIYEAIELFRPILPGDFIGSRSAFKKKSTREAVEGLLRIYTLDQIAELIWRYYKGRYEQYRPQVGTVLEFATTKLAKIIQFVESPESAEHSYAGVWESGYRLTMEIVMAEEAENEKLIEEAAKWYQESLMAKK